MFGGRVVWKQALEPNCVFNSSKVYELIRAHEFFTKQSSLIVFFAQDNTTRSWWLAVENTLVGYWPGSLFKNMAGNADIIQWGGQVHNSLPRGRHTSTQMGSGHFPDEGFRKSAFFDKCVYFDTDTNIGKTPRDGYQKVVSKPTCYGISDIYPVEGGPGVGFFFGGPGGPSCDK